MIAQQGLWAERLAAFREWKREVNEELGLSYADVLEAGLRFLATPRSTDRLTGFIDQEDRPDVFSFSQSAPTKSTPHKKLKAQDLLTPFPHDRSVSV